MLVGFYWKDLEKRIDAAKPETEEQAAGVLYMREAVLYGKKNNGGVFPTQEDIRMLMSITPPPPPEEEKKEEETAQTLGAKIFGAIADKPLEPSLEALSNIAAHLLSQKGQNEKEWLSATRDRVRQARKANRVGLTPVPISDTASVTENDDTPVNT